MSHPIDTLDILHIYSAGPLLEGNWLTTLTQYCHFIKLDNYTQESGLRGLIVTSELLQHNCKYRLDLIELFYSIHLTQFH